jgi:hypothetical protein
MLGISLLQYVKRQAPAAWPGLSTEQLLDQLRQIEKYCSIRRREIRDRTVSQRFSPNRRVLNKGWLRN